MMPHLYQEIIALAHSARRTPHLSHKFGAVGGRIELRLCGDVI